MGYSRSTCTISKLEADTDDEIEKIPEDMGEEKNTVIEMDD